MSDEAEKPEQLEQPEPEKALCGWKMEPPARIVVTIDLDKIGQATALGCLVMVADVVKSWHAEVARVNRERHAAIVKPGSRVFGALTNGLRKMAGGR